MAVWSQEGRLDGDMMGTVPWRTDRADSSGQSWVISVPLDRPVSELGKNSTEGSILSSISQTSNVLNNNGDTHSTRNDDDYL